MVSALAEVDRRQNRRQSTGSAATPALERDVPKFSGELASHVSTEPSITKQDADPKEQQPAFECIICFDEMACVVFTACGHLAYCKSCRRKALKRSLGKNWSDISSYNKALRSRMICPLCRQESRTEELGKFKGTVFQ